MKKILLSLLSFIALEVCADVTSWATFNFSDPYSLGFVEPLTNVEKTYLKGSGDVLNVTNREIKDGDVSMTFGLGGFKEGVAINHVISDEDETLSVYSLSLRTYATLTVSVPEGYTLDSIVFTGSLATLSKVVGDPGAFYPSTKTWSPNGQKASQVTFQNGQAYDTRITSVRVKYTRPAIPLVLQSSTPEEGQTVKSFQSMTLRFNTPVVDTVTTKGIQITRLGQPGVAMKANFSGNTVTLSLDQPVSSSAPYTVKVPAGCFVNDEGSVNSELSIRFKARVSLDYASVDPDPQESHRTLTDSIVLTYPTTVVVAKDAFGMLFHDGEDKGMVEILQEKSPSMTILLRLMTGKITDEGKWTIFIPEGSIHNTYYKADSETVSDFDSWNEEMSLTYTVQIPVLPEMIAAKELIAVEGIGYPAKESASRLALEEVIAKGEEATAEELVEAMDAFYNETDVELPGDSLWYHIVGVNAENADETPSKVYLKYADDRVSLTKDAAQASPFLSVMRDDKFMFVTPDKKHYLHVLTTREDLMETSAANVTDKESFLNHLSVAKLSLEDADSTRTFGKLAVTGVLLSLQADEVRRDTMTMAIDHVSTTIIDSAKDILYFDEQQSSAFVFEAAQAPFNPDESVYPTAKLGSESVVEEGKMLTLEIQNVKTATLVNRENPYFTKNGERVEYEADILSATSTANVFMVNTSSLPVGNYVLVLPVGTFEYEKLDKDVIDTEIQLPFVVKEYQEPVIPDPEFQYSYNGQFACLQTIMRVQLGVTIIADSDLNDFVLFANLGNPYSAMIPDTTKVVEVRNFYNGKVYRTGHFFPYPEIAEDYPDQNLINVQAIKLVLDEPIKYGDINEAFTAAYFIPRATFGDANFGLWLEDKSSVRPEDCIVNEKLEYTFLVNNQYSQGIRNIFNMPTDDMFFDLQGRKVNTPTKPGVYVVNGKKRLGK